ncbi:Alpha/Beta hydrolase protein, partial [Roridomyces roridus]
DGHYVDLPMGRTRYWLVGPESGSKVVLIHGLSVPAFVWEPLIPQLRAAGNRVLVYDLYGRGYSDAPAAGVVYDPHLYRTRLVGYSMGGAITAAFVATFPRLVEDDIVLIASAGLVESSDLPRTAKVMSSPIVQLLTANPIIKAYLRRLATSRSSPSSESAGVNTLAELVRLQSAHLPGFNRAVSSSLRSGPVRGMSWAFESEGWRGRRVLVVHGTQDNTVPSAHAARIRGLIVEAGASTNSTSSLPSSPPSSTSSPTRKWSWFASASDSSSSLERELSARVEVEMIPGAGHALTWTHADEVGGLVCRFLGGDGV